MKRFVICLDGTWNNASREVVNDEGAKVFRPTNVLKLARATRLRDEHGTSQITYYDAGVGGMNRAPDMGSKIVRWTDNKIGGAWGGGFDVNIEEAYTFLANNYTAGDEIFIFGFSRGASQARSLCRLIEWFGGFPTKNDVYYLPRIFTRYLAERGERGSTSLWDELNERRRTSDRKLLDDVVPANIVLLGVWDTVLALGSRLRAGSGTTNEKKQFHTPPTPPAIVRHVRHAIAIDEQRNDFQPELFRPDTGHPSLEQRWFAGVHSNVGGGMRRDGLANCALKWIVDEAVNLGLEVRHEGYLEFFGPFPFDTAPKKTLGFKIADFLLRPLRGFHGVRDLMKEPGMVPDATVFERLNADPKQHERLDEPYRPENLLKFLAANSEYDGQLGAAALADVNKHRNA